MRLRAAVCSYISAALREAIGEVDVMEEEGLVELYQGYERGHGVWKCHALS